VRPLESAGVNPTEAEEVAVADVETGTLTALFPGARPQYEPQSGHLVFVRGTTLMAVLFDPRRREPRGVPFPVEEGVGGFGLSRDGTSWQILGAISRRHPVLLDARGQPRSIMPELSDREEFEDAYFSPDGRRLVLELRAEGARHTDLWVYELPAGPRTRLTYDGGRFPAWTTEGDFVLFTRDDGVYRVRADASAPPQQVLRAEGVGWIQPTPAGGIVFERYNGRDLDVGTASLRDGAEVRTLVSGPANEEDPAVSPNGRWLAYESDETGRREVYVMPFGQSGRGRRVSVAGGGNPFWSRDGNRLFFTNGNDEFEALRVRAATDFEVAGRSVLFDRQRYAGRMHPGEGDSVFVAVRSGGARTGTRLILVRNWTRELLERAREARRQPARQE
jgi:hypothetical protein